MLTFLSSALGTLSPVTCAFIAVILAVWALFNLRYSARVIELGPTILTTIGIFGTFLGVALGLARFDTTNVQASVPALLAGLKTAFWASVFGVGAAVQIKLREFAFGAPQATTGDEEQEESPGKVLADIRQALSGTGEASLLSQVKLMRQDMNDRLLSQVRMARQDANERLDAVRAAQEKNTENIQMLREAQTAALRTLAAQASSTIVDAMREVVLSFNEKVAEQFGANYRELGEAVSRLLAWQTQYRETIEVVTNRLDDTVRVLGYATSDLKRLGEAAEGFQRTAERVNRTLETVEASEKRLGAMAASVSQLTEAAAGRVPYIEARLGELVSQMANAVRDSQEQLSTALAQSAAAMTETMAASQAGFAEVAKAGAAAVAENQAAIAGALTENAAAMRAALEETRRELNAANTAFAQQTIGVVQATRDQVAQLDHDVSNELAKSVAKLTAQLKALSAQMARNSVVPDEMPKIALVAG
jgi:hypothetical protein